MPSGAGVRANYAAFDTSVHSAAVRLIETDSIPAIGPNCKEIVGAGQQQVRFVWANIGAFHICLWTFTMTEAWAWRRAETDLVDRNESPWDDPDRRPSHADKRRAWRRELLAEEIRAVVRPGVNEEEIQAVAKRLLGLAA